MDESERGRAEQEERFRRWMVAAQDGDAQSYDSLLRALVPWIRRRVAMRVDGASDREDIVQNVLVALHRARHTYRPEHPFAPWLGTLVRNASIDWLRRQGRRRRFEWDGDLEALPEPAAPSPASARDPFEADDSTVGAELGEALAALPNAQREAVELIHLEGLSVADAAARAGTTPGALKVRAHRGYRALRALLSRRES